MAYDLNLASRMQKLVEKEEGFTAKNMFGGVAYQINGNMACGVHGENMIARVGREEYDSLLAEPYVTVFDMSSRPMKGWVMTKPEGVSSDAELRKWVEKGVKFALTLPAK